MAFKISIGKICNLVFWYFLCSQHSLSREVQARDFHKNASSDFYLTAPSQDFLYFTEIEKLSGARYYRSNAHLCDNSKDLNAKKRFICSVLSPELHLTSYSNSDLDLDSKSDVVFMGESHIDLVTQLEFANLLPHLSDQGFTTLALEMFPASTQKELDLFSEGKLSINEIIKILDKHWYYKKEGYLKILLQAKALNMKIIGIDDRENIKHKDLWTEVAMRDDFMATTLAEKIISSNNKIIVYTGKMHAVKSFGDKKERGLSQKLIDILSLENLIIKTENYLFTPFHRSYVFEYFLNANGALTNQSHISINPSYTKFADAVIYLRSENPNKMNELQFTSLSY